MCENVHCAHAVAQSARKAHHTLSWFVSDVKMRQDFVSRGDMWADSSRGQDMVSDRELGGACGDSYVCDASKEIHPKGDHALLAISEKV